jgi:DNA-binding CsgD family transcriptional regulator
MTTAIVGRGAELEAVEDVLEAATESLAGLVFEGEAGIGKTTVWREGTVRARACGYEVLACRATAAEARLSYSALADLLAPVGEAAFSILPTPQRRALDVALLRADGTDVVSERRAVCAAVLSILEYLTESTPLALAIDDVQWLDGSTARVVEFAVRRLEERPAALFLTRRIGSTTDSATMLSSVPHERLRRLTLGPLTLAALHTIVKAELGESIPRPLLVRIERASHGNPFTAIELARSLQSGSRLSHGDLRVPDDLRKVLVSRVRRLPASAREAMLVVASLSTPTTAVVDEADLAPAEEAGIVTVDGKGRIEFAHPLLGWAVYTSASTARRRRIHVRLADEIADPEEQARHLALATAAPDEGIARLVEAGAERARARGAPDAAGELAEAAARLTPPADARARCRRVTAAASHFFHAGDPQRARALVESELREAPPGRERGEALQLLAEVSYHENSFVEATKLLDEALAEDDAPEFVVPVLLALAYTSFSAGDMQRALALAETTLEQAERLGNDALLAEALVVTAVGQMLFGPGPDWKQLARAVELEDRSRPIPMQMRPSTIAAELTSYDGRLGEALDRLHELRRWFVVRGGESDLPYLLLLVTWIHWRAGDFPAALDASTQAFELAEQAGSQTLQGAALASRATVLASLGDVEGARAELERAYALLAASGWVVGVASATGAAGFLALSLDDFAAAEEAFRPLLDLFEAMVIPKETAMALPDAVEALVIVGDVERAEQVVTACEKRAREIDLTWLSASAARSRSVVCAGRGDLDAALVAAEEAVVLEERTEMRFELARALLVRGRVERRLRRRAAARRSLERSLEICDELGAPLWAAKARAELDRLGTPGRSGELTATELRVARLAGDGLTNAEIASELRISRRTVESNLARSYRKLGIRSRAQISAALGARRAGGP